ncbi:MAG: ATP-binding cassette domain-containing protein [Rhodoferax sp.]|nr:MAG: ATP-binding cassette domain-containing protein [Rhodoferax sp.]
MNSNLYVLQDAALHYGQGRVRVQALQGVTLSIAPGERVALVGANGCGKSSLLRLLHGLHRPSAGTVQRAAQLRQAMLFQRPFVLRMGVLRNLQLALWIAGTPWGQTRTLAEAALQRVGMVELATRNARHLSGGQQQRVALARAWALEPQVLLLDEPTASLDPHAKREVEALVEEFAAQSPTAALVFASHNLGQVKRLASRVIYLQQGRVLADLAVADFFDRALVEHHHPGVDAFLRGEMV